MQNGGSRRRPLGRVTAVCIALLLGARSAAQPARDDAASNIARGIVALHHFEYEDANESFRRAQTLDPGDALAYWGEALTYDQALWRREDVRAARQALNRLAPTPALRAAKARNARARGLIGAADLLFGDGDRAARHARYTEAMARLHADLPADSDVTALYALALMSTASRSLIGFDDAHQSGGHALAGSDTQKQVASLLEEVLRREPRHPGALHYLLHDYDDPEHARLALDAARAYATIAAGSSHAMHMPAHIFLQMGLWHDAAAADRAAYQASVESGRRRNLGAATRNFHALEWLEYELLQLGRYREASETIGEIEPVVRASGALTPGAPAGDALPLLSDLSSMRARFAVETRRWTLLAHERNFGNVDELCAIGISAARTNNLELARIVRQALADRARSPQEGDLRPAVAVMEQEVAGLIALAEGRRDEAVSTMRAASDAELALPAPLGVPRPIKPAPELLGELLLELGQPRDAVAPFEAALRRNANRSLSVLGLARAASATGDAASARQRYEQLLASYDGADSDLPELAEARNALARAPQAPMPTSRVTTTAVWAGAIAAAILLIVVVRRREPRKTGTTKNKKTTKLTKTTKKT